MTFEEEIRKAVNLKFSSDDMTGWRLREAHEIVQRDDEKALDGRWLPAGKWFYSPIGEPVGIQKVRCRSDAPASTDPLKVLEEERGKVYGSPRSSHANIGLSWSAILQQHYGITLDHPIPDFVVALMMTTFKCQRSARVFKEDNYDDGAVYLGFAKRFQQNKE
jgi:hypothetical protein